MASMPVVMASRMVGSGAALMSNCNTWLRCFSSCSERRWLAMLSCVNNSDLDCAATSTLRSEISLAAAWASSVSTLTSVADQWRGWKSITQKLPRRWPSGAFKASPR